ncbi:hypothetical protein K503DRAFT_472813 [Rhizopogon vinicolor AM-OR11-026]|uniref:Uncharacterized protein n=1 Tax=Rhizopogon vinicolor AM-OR11-026 TaxID=1314800 RepID=A0A1B7MNA3_9AGAM|nr:hypothetical protein K503DRAFT_472813 [Rhizopogon vinicolor AM-OR11-026]
MRPKTDQKRHAHHVQPSFNKIISRRLLCAYNMTQGVTGQLSEIRLSSRVIVLPSHSWCSARFSTLPFARRGFYFPICPPQHQSLIECRSPSVNFERCIEVVVPSKCINTDHVCAEY